MGKEKLLLGRMMTTQQPEALRLADALTEKEYPPRRAAAEELRRLHSVNAQLLEALGNIAAAEREAIAQMVEDAPPLAEFVKNDKGGCMVCGFTPKLAAAAIRARG